MTCKNDLAKEDGHGGGGVTAVAENVDGKFL